MEDRNVFGRAVEDLFDPDDYFRIERYYEDIKDHTFDTVVLPLSLQEAEELAKYREVSKFFSQMRSFSGGAQIPEMKLPESTKKVMDDISSRLDKVFAEFGGAAFVKLSTRSPKDAVLTSPKIKTIIEEELNEIEQEEYKALDWNVRSLIAFTRACSKTMKVTTGHEAIELLFNSDRTYQDISRMKLMFGEEKFEMKLIARKWVEIDPELEFRTFVVNKKITGCTQYYPLCYVPKLSQNKDHISKLVLDYFEQIKDLIKVDTYTIDFVLSRDLKSIQIIELNNPPPTAGVSLFDWDSTSDRKILTEGPYEMRILDALPAKAMSEVYAPLRLFMQRLELVQKKSRGEIEEFDEEQFICHLHIGCNICRDSPIIGPRFHCLQCKGCYDLCRKCFEDEIKTHDKLHQFEVHRGTDQPVVLFERSNKKCAVM